MADELGVAEPGLEAISTLPPVRMLTPGRMSRAVLLVRLEAPSATGMAINPRM